MARQQQAPPTRTRAFDGHADGDDDYDDEDHGDSINTGSDHHASLDHVDIDIDSNSIDHHNVSTNTADYLHYSEYLNDVVDVDAEDVPLPSSSFMAKQREQEQEAQQAEEQEQDRQRARQAAHQAGQGTSESGDRQNYDDDYTRGYAPQQVEVDVSRFHVTQPLAPGDRNMPPQEEEYGQNYYQAPPPSRINEVAAIALSQVRALGETVYQRGRRSYRTLRRNYHGGYDGSGDGHENENVDENESDLDSYDDGDDEERGGATTAARRASTAAAAALATVTAANAASYLSDMCSLLLVLLQAPFLWCYFVVTGRDYHDRYGTVQPHGEGAYGGVYGADGAGMGGADGAATTSQRTFGSRTSRMTAEEKQERSEVYLEAKDEDGTLFAMLAFHHPGLCPLVDETVDNVELVQVLGEDTAKTGHTDLAAALTPDGCMALPDSDDEDDSGWDWRSVELSEASEAFGGGADANRSGRSRTSNRSGGSRTSRSSQASRGRGRRRSKSVDARLRRRDRGDDEWEYDITTQKMKRKKKE